jgi:hypothetical protein
MFELFKNSWKKARDMERQFREKERERKKAHRLEMFAKEMYIRHLVERVQACLENKNPSPELRKKTEETLSDAQALLRKQERKREASV